MSISLNRRALVPALLAAVFLLFVAACGSGDGNDNAATAHNDADVEFARNMIPHHEQAIDMAKLAQARATAPALKAMAERIRGAQDPEIQRMSRWLEDWNESRSATGMESGHGTHSMPGMMSATEMSDLEKANGEAFDQMFLAMMIRHHGGAIEMARAEQRHGKNTAAKQLARSIEADQTAEIAEMKGLQK